MIHSLLSYLVASFAVVATGQLTSGVGSSSDINCCPYGSILIENKCHLYETPGQFFLCEYNDIYDSTMRICINQYDAIEGTPCKDQYIMEQGTGDLF
jgi:hypothetical protein